MTAPVLLLLSSLLNRRSSEGTWKYRRGDAMVHFKRKLPELVREHPGKFALVSPEGECRIYDDNFKYFDDSPMRNGDKAWGFHVFRIPKKMPSKWFNWS